MTLRINTPCDFDGSCPYDSQSWRECTYWCGAIEPEDKPEIYEEED